MQKGGVVKSVAGHDKDRFYVIVDVQGERILIADGKCRRLAKPKAKNRKHLSATNMTLDLSAIQSDHSLRTLLRPYNQPRQNSQRGR